MLNELRVYFNILLCRLGIRDILPKEAIGKIRVLENNDPLVDISGEDSFLFDAALQKPIYIRNEVCQRLKQVADKLPDGMHLKIYDAYRSPEKQQEFWEKALEQTKQERKGLPQKEVERLTRLKVADSSRGGYGGHQTGGAIDLTLCDKDGKELEQGTRIGEFNQKTKTTNQFLLEEERQNRKLLYDAMIFAGFNNFPGEWWHFSYGDKLWAAYSGHKSCFYGNVHDII